MEVSFRGIRNVAVHACHSYTDKTGLPLTGRKHHQTSTSVSAVSSLTAGALVSGCSRRGRASCWGRTGSIFLLISATVSAFAFLSLVALLVGHFTRFGCQVLISTSINGCCDHRRLTFLWTPFLQCFAVFLFVLLLRGSPRGR